MKLKRAVLYSLFLIYGMTFSQEFNGMATYKTKRKVDIKMDSTKVNSDMQEKMLAMLQKQFEKTFILTFNKDVSLYKEEESLAPPQPSGMQIVVFSAGGADILFKDIKEERYVNQNDLFGKIFLVKDSLTPIKWELGKETKNIGTYTCFKATYTKEIETIEGGVSVNGDKDLDKQEPVKKSITVTAWYTPQIPVSHGPEMFQGLPGLILEINDGTQSIMCSKIILNPDKEINLDEPKKGKEVSQKEYDEILEDKMQEMKERRAPNRGKGEEIEIRIGG
ncbi:GLPGLI family protein [Aegicerativicinus sediminis]|uniref:GLPGLI family protein n=1 Tax=Aegicerativicinus sediminis TaxID=2893202 RepID=UPI001E45FE57|nr:GLPGLI family protein [Aegicerativicinus sediminis]